MDDTRPTPPGNVEPTPEAGPLHPPTMRDHYAGPLPQPPAVPADVPADAHPTGQAGASAGGGPEPERGADEIADEIAKDFGGRLKPVVAAAEDVATRALDLSAKGLGKLVDKLEARRRHRDDAEPS